MDCVKDLGTFGSRETLNVPWLCPNIKEDGRLEPRNLESMSKWWLKRWDAGHHIYMGALVVHLLFHAM
jgi:hypothetical protein